MKIPPQTIVDPFSIELSKLRSQSISCPNTSLFGKVGQLGEITRLAIEAYDPESTFAYTSVGCSFGAELDSTAALLTAQGVQQANVQGIDIDPTTLKEAEHGRYMAPSNIPFVHSSRNKQLRKVGFLTVLTGGRVLIDSRDVRAKHTVNFHLLDLGQESFNSGRQNLVTCHNVLPHVAEHDPQKARAMAARLCSLVTEGGILSIANGLERYADTYNGDVHAEQEVKTYGDVHRKMVATMRMRYKMEIELRDKDGNVAALRKVR